MFTKHPTDLVFIKQHKSLAPNPKPLKQNNVHEVRLAKQSIIEIWVLVKHLVNPLFTKQHSNHWHQTLKLNSKWNQCSQSKCQTSNHWNESVHEDHKSSAPKAHTNHETPNTRSPILHNDHETPKI